MRFRIHPSDTIYRFDDIGELTLRQHLLLEEQSGDLGRRLDMETLSAMDNGVRACKSDAERRVHPDAPWLLAVCIWAARVRAGDEVTFGEAIDFPMARLEYLPEPADHPKKAANPTRARPGSGRAAKRAAVPAKTSANRSKTRSTAASS